MISEKNILQTDFEGKKKLARKYLPYNGFVYQGKKFITRGLEKKILTQTKSPILPTLTLTPLPPPPPPAFETALIFRHFEKWLLVLCTRLSHLVATLWL